MIGGRYRIERELGHGMGALTVQPGGNELFLRVGDLEDDVREVCEALPLGEDVGAQAGLTVHAKVGFRIERIHVLRVMATR